MTAYDVVVARLTERGYTGRNGMWRCPAHDDNTPSLSVTPGEGQALVNCFAGCDTEDVVTKLELTMADLFDTPRSSGQRRILRTHDYVDENGTLLYQTVRFAGTGPDRFRQRRPDGNGDWIWNLKDVRRVVYNLPAVLEAIDNGTPVLLPEGEHDADALTRAGAVATTNPLGAANWRPEYTEMLKGAKVAIVVDRDDTGTKRGAFLQAELEAAGIEVVAVYEPVEGKDAAEVLGMGFDLDTGFQIIEIPRDNRDNTWESPAPLARAADLPTFPVDVFPKWMRDHVQAVSDFTQTPIDLPATVGLAALATATGGRVEVQVRGPWHEPSNLYTVTSLPPGSRKSAVFAAMAKPIYLAEKALVEEIEPTIMEVETMLAVEEAKLKRAKDAAAKAENTTQSEKLRDEAVSLANTVAEQEEAIPPRPRLIADDVTPEACATLVGQQDGRLGVLSAEGGIFQILAGRYSNAPNLDLFLKGHAGDPLRVDRKNAAPLIVDKPALTLGLTVQPEVLRAISDMPGFRGRGLLARILYALPKNTVGYRQVGVIPPADEIANQYEVFLSDLARLFFEQKETVVVTLSGGAAAALLEEERALELRLRPDADLCFIVDWAAKLIGATARIAVLLHVAKQLGVLTEPIPEETMRDAIRVGGYFTAHAVAAFEFMGVDPAVEGARYLLDWIERTRPTEFTRRDAHRGCRQFKKVSDLDPALAVLEDHGYIRRRPVPEPAGRGRPPAPTFDVNPETTGQNGHK